MFVTYLSMYYDTLFILYMRTKFLRRDQNRIVWGLLPAHVLWFAHPSTRTFQHLYRSFEVKIFQMTIFYEKYLGSQSGQSIFQFGNLILHQLQYLPINKMRNLS